MKRIIFFFLFFITLPKLYSQWSTNGKLISTTPATEFSQRICQDGRGGAYVVWEDNRDMGTSRKDIYIQHVTSNGLYVYPINGKVLCNAIGDQNLISVASDETGGVFVCWEDSRSGTNTQVYAQRVDSIGNMLWATNGVALSSNTTSTKSVPSIIMSSASEPFAIFNDNRNGNLDIFAQKISMLDGTAIGPEIQVVNAVGDQDSYNFCKDGVDGIIITWRDKRNAADADIYMQRIDGAGMAKWATNGVNATLSIGGNQFAPIIFLNGNANNGYTLFWNNNTYPSPQGNNYKNVDTTGSTIWLKSIQGDSKLIMRTSAGNFIVAYIVNIYNQLSIKKISSSGDLIWDKPYFSWGSGSTQLTGYGIVTDDGDNSLITIDLRGNACAGCCFGQVNKFDAAGNTIWSASLPISYNYYYLRSISVGDGAGGILTASYNYLYNTPTGIYLSKRYSNGALPLQLLDFNASKTGNNVGLVWQTLNEDNFSHFIIEHSTNGSAFNTIGKVESLKQGNNSSNTYHFMHLPLKGMNYYRLKMYDLDGTFTYSKIESVNISSNQITINIYPNPAKDNILIYHPKANARTFVRLIEMSGRELLKIPLQINSVNTSLNVKGIKPGVYLLTWENGESFFSKEVIIQ